MNGALFVAGVALIGGLGAVARFAIHSAIVHINPADFPLGTFLINVSGAFAAGVMLGAGAGDDLTRLIGTGFLGAFTTFSTWMFESERLIADGYARAAAMNILISTALGLGAAALGVVVAG